jgi:hypothetical protein
MRSLCCLYTSVSRPSTFEHNLTWRLKAGLVEPEKTAIAIQRLGEGVPVATYTHLYAVVSI